MKMQKDLKYYLNLPYTIRIFKYTEYNGEDYFGAEILELPGCGAEGKTREEALAKLQEAKRAWIEVSLERNLEIPEPKKTSLSSIKERKYKKQERSR